MIIGSINHSTVRLNGKDTACWIQPCWL